MMLKGRDGRIYTFIVRLGPGGVDSEEIDIEMDREDDDAAWEKARAEHARLYAGAGSLRLSAIV